ncbi:Uncharacterised protein [Serratia marcescens]|uniref:hypothetical protein n=1 Tax=Serratia marcescens TaxID=615 RepID=UPI00217AFBCA|nr:hypothetical protein [Serratia marcescens]CAI1109711.1 Uncharacterised protein [Serratia marcescens]CAI1120827.1 Uncharacterised protein [Serratia marcescens]CAI1840120.1 Uncharacterised protein [Serratia marcescens]CAI1969176.1 Uncharacterised protein [Serratia marcescens]
MLDFIKDIFSSFRQSSIERIKNPFVGAFVFSWLGFNWQILAIITFSKKDIIERVDYIKAHYDVGHFILAPSLTTIAICIILPWANKIFTKLQSKPISDTTSILMQAKIDIAEKQLQIANFEAKKKLAEKREERNIEEDIESKNIKLDNAIKEKNNALEEISLLRESLRNEKSDASLFRQDNSNLKQSLINEQKLYSELAKITAEKDKNISDLQREINKIAEENLKLKENFDAQNFANSSLIEQANRDAEIIKKYHFIAVGLERSYPKIFTTGNDGFIKVIPSSRVKLKELNKYLITDE